jgi:hypothetical protein
VGDVDRAFVRFILGFEPHERRCSARNRREQVASTHRAGYAPIHQVLASHRCSLDSANVISSTDRRLVGP